MAKKRRTSPKSKRGKASPGTAPGVAPAKRRRWRSLLRPDPLALGLIAAALLIRAWGVGDHLPDPTLGINVLDDSAVEETDRTTMGRAWSMWNGGNKPLDLNPHTGGWPGFSFYFGLGLQAAYKVVYSISHPGTTSLDFARHIREGSNHLFLFARAASVLIGAWTVFLAFRLGVGVVGRAAGLLAGLFLALNPLHIMTSQHIADPNLLALLFVLLAALAMVRVVKRGGPRDSVGAGAMIGFGAACKYVPLVLVLPLALAHGRHFFRSRVFYLALLAALLAVFAASPYTFLDWKMTLQDFSTQRRALFSDWVGQTTFPFSLPTYLGVSLPHAMGWPAYLLALPGMWLLWRRGPVARPVALIPAVMVLANGALKAAQERYMLVAMPILFLGAAVALLGAIEWLRARAFLPARAAIGALALLGALAIAWPLPEFLAIRRALSLPDTRHLARKWINANIGADKPMAVELYGPVFQPDERAVVIWPFFATQVPLVRPAYHAEFLDGLDYYVLSREISRRFDADSISYPVESAFYRWIRARAPIVWRSDPKSSSGPQIEVRRVPSSISTRAERESLFARAMPAPSRVGRLGLWCVDLANTFGKLGRYEQAEEWATRGLRIDAKRMNPRLHATLAFVRLNQGELTKAEEAARAGISESPRDHPIRLYRAMALQGMGRMEEALAEFQAAYELSRDGRILLNVGSALSDLGRYDEALRQLGQVPPNHPERAAARRAIAVILLNNVNRPTEGLAALREAATLTRDPEEAKALWKEVDRLERMARPRAGPSAP